VDCVTFPPPVRAVGRRFQGGERQASRRAGICTSPAAGLVASVLASSPAWRHVDPLPVLGRDDEEEEQWDEAEEEDKDHEDDEHRAAWVLEERETS
jgi:hypothetical protein